MAGAIAKPQLRNLMLSSLKIHVPIAIALALGSSLAFKIYVRDARRDKIAEFHRTYDGKKECERLMKLGLFDIK